jgi:hypothetical protein
MPTTTDGIVYPAYTDDPDIPGDMQALAESVDGTYAIKTDTYTKAQVDTAVNGKLDEGDLTNGITGKSRLHIGSASITPATGGLATITHGAGFTPDHVICTVSDTDAAVSTAKGLTCNVLWDTLGATTFQVRIYKNTDATGHDQACRVAFICIKN